MTRKDCGVGSPQLPRKIQLNSLIPLLQPYSLLYTLQCLWVIGDCWGCSWFHAVPRKSLGVPHHPTNEALLKCLSCRQAPAPLRSLPASLCAFCLLSNNFSWTHPALWNVQDDFMHLFSGETQYFLCPVGPHSPRRSKMKTCFVSYLNSKRHEQHRYNKLETN